MLRSNLHIKSKDPHEKLSRHWYLTVIILLYVGLITSVCLNVSLLLKNNPEHSAREIKLQPHQFGSYVAETLQSKYTYKTNYKDYTSSVCQYQYLKHHNQNIPIPLLVL